MTHPTIEAMARAICDAAFPVNPDCHVEVTTRIGDSDDNPQKKLIPAWELYGLEPAKAAARALLTAEPSKAEVEDAAMIIFEQAVVVGEIFHPVPSWVIKVARNALKAARAAQMKEIGL